jgi:hypothetical protein
VGAIEETAMRATRPSWVWTLALASKWKAPRTRKARPPPAASVAFSTKLCTA